MNWGKWIVVSFVLFAAFIGALVIVCVNQDISLVSREYYQEELAYGEQINRINNTELLSAKPDIKIVGEELLISFDDFSKVESGELNLFRPSNAGFDQAYTIPKGSEPTRTFDISQLPSGMYKARMKWLMDGKEYYIEEIINL